MRGLFRIIETIHSGTPQYGLCETLGDAYLGLAIMHYVSTVHHVPLHPSHSRKAGRCDRYGVLPWMLIIHHSGCILRNTSTTRLTAYQ